MARLVHTFSALDPSDPTGVQTRDIGLEQTQVDVLLHEEGTVNDKVRLARLLLAKEVAQAPEVIFEDLKRPNHEDGLCYCGRPSHDFRGPRIETPAPPNMVFCVFVVSSGKISAWRWEPCDELEPDYPEDWKNRFGRIVWPPGQRT